MNDAARVKAIAGKLSVADLQLLEVCQDFEKALDGTFCATWIRDTCAHRGIQVHQSSLGRLARLGLLDRDDSTRGGGRRYYRIKDGELVRAVLAALTLTS